MPEFVQPAVQSQFAMMVFDPAAMAPEHFHALENFGVVRDDHPAVAEAAQILAGEEAQAARIAE